MSKRTDAEVAEDYWESVGCMRAHSADDASLVRAGREAGYAEALRWMRGKFHDDADLAKDMDAKLAELGVSDCEFTHAKEVNDVV